MTDKELFDGIQEFLDNTNVVKIGNYYYNSVPLLDCLKQLRRRELCIAAGLDDRLSPVERMMLHILIDVAGLNHFLEQNEPKK